MKPTTLPGGVYNLASDIIVNRIGYGAMQLAGPGVFGPPRDHDAAINVLREVVRLGINHIDTSDFYGPHVTNQLIKEALHPYAESLHLVTKVGARRDDKGNWLPAFSADELRQAVHNNLENLGLDALEVVNFRVHASTEGDGHGPAEGSIAEPFKVLADMQREGLIRHLGISTATSAQIKEAQGIAPIVCVQNQYNIAHREDDALIDELAAQGIAYVPYFPLGGFSPLQSQTLNNVAERLEISPMALALAWLLHRSDNILLIPGTSSIDHLRENVAGAGTPLSDDVLQELNAIATASE